MLPITTIIPIRNCRSRLEYHLSNMAGWSQQVAEIIVIDSFSKDGSLDYVKKNLHHPRIRFYNHPPGLYESWNFAIRKSTSPYIYISTIGDTISLDGLKHLFKYIQVLDGDVLISPPNFKSDDSKRKKFKNWPIHDIIKVLEIDRPTLIENDVFSFFILYFHKAGIIGSSASNLYKSSVLKKYPFPENFGPPGDSAWFIKNNYKISCGVTPQKFSSFLYHEKNYDLEKNSKKEMNTDRAVRDIREDFIDLISNVLYERTLLKKGIADKEVVKMQTLFKFLKEYTELKRKYIKYRYKKGLFCYFNPIILRIQRKKSNLRKERRKIAFREAKQIHLGNIYTRKKIKTSHPTASS